MIKQLIKLETARSAFVVLGLEDEPDVYDAPSIDARWRRLRAELHPDRNLEDPNAASRFDTARKAHELARAYAQQPKPCGDCEGKGKVEKPSSNPLATPMKINCKTCRGSGVR